ncbi:MULTISPECIES: DUF3369 domain-containing protein [unclassified Motilimonas]|uniref:DUF3369 domain-containing protein n=1 Tax=Motilimonas TaxID=1914248 RepID=UPI001E46ED7B|nr:MULTISPECIES: DUF3369 domain-containing protein [unclassified Motilimonas]MCE0558032.1 DUF3369 domain-containing protein [Motilimonas sp. E26]MDO6526037.1 DUF3369 domain-containing protein [Motilimonas sp. 1_MG-2023]
MADDDDILIFEDDEPAEETLHAKSAEGRYWKVMIVDDEQDIHSVTRMVTHQMEFMDLPVKTISAYSGAEAKKMIKENPDTALMFLDVVMETDHAGLDVVKYVRDELQNTQTRIILRTGQPGQAPELNVIVEYDINDYKEKAELTSQKLRTTIYASLRNYRDIQAIELTKRSLESMIKYSHELLHEQAIHDFATHVLTQLTTLLHLGDDALYYRIAENTDEREVLVGIGEFAEYSDFKIHKLPECIQAELSEVHRTQNSLYYGDRYIAYFRTEEGSEHILYSRGKPRHEFSEYDQHLIEVYCHHVATAFSVFNRSDHKK